MTSPLERSSRARLLMIGNVPVDLTLRLDRWPRRGEDIRADEAMMLAGGGFHVLRAARRAGLRAAYAGTHGTGPLGDLVRAALVDLDCELLQRPMADRDSGWVVVLVDSTGERTFVTSPDTVVGYDKPLLDSLRPAAHDLVYVSGYSLGLAELSRPLAAWVAALDPGPGVFCDLGPWGAAASTEILSPVLERLDWLSCSGDEAILVTGAADPAAACTALQRRTRNAVVLVRAGARGCWVATPSGDLELLPAPDVGRVLDTTGAGDTHSGAFLGAVAAGASWRAAVQSANAAAALAVSVTGTASWAEAAGVPAVGEEG